MNYQTTITIDGTTYDTLLDILPEEGDLNILFIGRTPSLKSIVKGHYFQGKRGHNFWKKLNDLGILKVPAGEYSDDYLLRNRYGVTHVSKIPREFKNPTKKVYREGYDSLMEIINKYHPKLLVFTYKNTLDSLVSAVLNENIKTRYGFNPEYDYLFHSAVFVYPMPGTICRRDEMEMCITDLMLFVKKEHIIK